MQSEHLHTLFYVGLESIESRYTLQLTDWNKRTFADAGLVEGTDFHIVTGTELTPGGKINVGAVLDCYNRPYYALSQVQNLIALFQNGTIKYNDVIFFEDMFHPGIEALPYIFSQSGVQPRVYVRCLAQSIDPDDFVHTIGLGQMMRKYEQLVNSFVTGVFMASHEMAAHATIAGWTVPIYVTGLPFDMHEVRSRVPERTLWRDKPLRVAFAARTDREKQPWFFIELADYWRAHSKVPVEFAFLSGRSDLAFNCEDSADFCRSAVAEGRVTTYTGLSKNEYYKLLSNSRVLFNCALQDWVSNTVSEADSLGTNVLYPAYRSFPETFFNDASRTYIPWSIQDAYLKLRRLMSRPHHAIGRIATHQSFTIMRTLGVMGMLLKYNAQCPDINPTNTQYRSSLTRDSVHETAPLTDWELTHTVTDEELLNSAPGSLPASNL